MTSAELYIADHPEVTGLGWIDVGADMLCSIAIAASDDGRLKTFRIKNGIPTGARMAFTQLLANDVIRIWLADCEPRQYEPLFSVEYQLEVT